MLFLLCDAVSALKNLNALDKPLHISFAEAEIKAEHLRNPEDLITFLKRDSMWLRAHIPSSFRTCVWTEEINLQSAPTSQFQPQSSPRIKMWMHAKSLSRVHLFGTLWTVTCQAPLSTGFSRQEHWSGLPCPPPGDRPDQRIEPASPVSPASAGRFFTASVTRAARVKERQVTPTVIWEFRLTNACCAQLLGGHSHLHLPLSSEQSSGYHAHYHRAIKIKTQAESQICLKALLQFSRVL